MRTTINMAAHQLQKSQHQISLVLRRAHQRPAFCILKVQVVIHTRFYWTFLHWPQEGEWTHRSEVKSCEVQVLGDEK